MAGEEGKDIEWIVYRDVLKFRTATPRWFFMAIGTPAGHLAANPTVPACSLDRPLTAVTSSDCACDATTPTERCPVACRDDLHPSRFCTAICTMTR